MKSFGRVILAFAVAVLGFASLVFDAGLGALRVNKFSTGFSRTPSQIVSTHTPNAGDNDNIGTPDDGHADDNNDNADEGHADDNDNNAGNGSDTDDDKTDDADNNVDDDVDKSNDVAGDEDGAGDNSGKTDDSNTGADDNSGKTDDGNAGANDDNAGNTGGSDGDNAGDGLGDDADDSKPIGDDTPLTELDLVKLELTQVMDDFVKAFSQFDFSIYTDCNGRVFELYCFGYLYTDGRFDTKWLKSTNVYDYQEAIASMKSLTTLVTKVLASAREEVPAPNLVPFEKYFESIDDYINQLNAEYQPLTYVTCQNTRPSK